MPIMNTVIKGSGGAAPAYYVEKAVDANGKLIDSNNLINLSGVKNISSYCLQYAYLNVSFTSNTIVDFVDLETISNGEYACKNAFSNTSGITAVRMNKLESLESNYCMDAMFSKSTNIVTVSMPLLKKIDGSYVTQYMFSECTSLTSADLGGLEIINGTSYVSQYMFFRCSALITLNLSSLIGCYGSCYRFCDECTALTNMSFDSLVIINGTWNDFFRLCTNLTSIRFPAIRTITSNRISTLCASVPNVTLHFPANTQTMVEALQGYSATAPFGAVAGSVLFDLPSTFILTGANSQEYERNPKYDTGTALAWRKKDTGSILNLVVDWTPFYTSGTTDPQANDTIYSDSACTTAVTTISSIA